MPALRLVRSALPGVLALLLLPLVLQGCDSGGTSPDGDDSGFTLDNCTIPTDQIVDGGVPRDGIPSLDGLTPDDDRLVRKDAGTAGYLADGNRVIGMLFGDQALAVPHNILWHHEIVNVDEWAGRTFAVTYCPLTGTSLAFDRSAVDGAEFGVSGLLFNNNLMMFDRRDNESLWPQMNRQANCGANVGTDLQMLPVVEMTWGAWKALHPDTKVISSRTGHSRNYTTAGYPYGDPDPASSYEAPNNDRLLFDIPIDDRRPPKERVLGIPDGDGGLAVPFGELDDGSEARVVEVTVGGTDMVVFWTRDAEGAMAYRPRTQDGQALSFAVQDGRIVDTETQRTWTLDGRARDGSARLEPVRTAFVAFWFAWAADSFHPETRIWEDPE
jgi:hypothetical protein